jgi:hypothetical protein
MDPQSIMIVLGLVGLVGGFIGWLLRIQNVAHHAVQALREDVYNFKLRSAEMYASISYLKDVETRIMMHLEKIDRKIDWLTDRNERPRRPSAD